MFLPWSSSEFFWKEYHSFKNPGFYGNKTWKYWKSLKTYLNIFSSTVFGENQRYCYSLGIVVIIVQKLTFCNVSVITEETQNMCSLSKEQSILSKENFFFRIMPLFTYTAFPHILFQQWLCGKAASGLERILC